MLQKAFLFFIYLFCITTPAFAQDPALDALQKKYSALSSFTVDFSQELYNSEAKETEKRAGKFTFKKPLLIFWETTTPLKEDIIISAKEIWNYIPEDNVAFKYPITMLNDVAVFIYVLSGQVNIEEKFTVKTTSATADAITFTLIPKKDNPSITTLELTMAKASSEITQIKITDFYYNTNIIQLSNFKENVEVKDSIFAFTPKEGVNIIDNSLDNINE